MKCGRCEKQAILHITEVISRDDFEELHVCDECGHRFIEAHQSAQKYGETPERIDGAVRFELTRIIISEVHDQQVVVLQEVGGQRIFPLVIGIFEATSLDRKIKQIPTPRPLTHDAWANTIISRWPIAGCFRHGSPQLHVLQSIAHPSVGSA